MEFNPYLRRFPAHSRGSRLLEVRRVGVLDVRSLIEGRAIREFVRNIAGDAAGTVSLIDASSLVDLAESGQFLFAPKETGARVHSFMAAIFSNMPETDVLTLSSTHLPWLLPFFADAAPLCRFLDPADDVVRQIGNGYPGTGKILGLATEDETYRLDSFREMLGRIGANIPVRLVTIKETFTGPDTKFSPTEGSGV